MPNYNYNKGVRKERKVVNEAKEEGCLAFRSAGSHSPIDVCIIDWQHNEIRFVQCKPETMSERNKQKILDDLIELNTQEFKVSFEVI
jgi:Holliday junction resolvase